LIFNFFTEVTEPWFSNYYPEKSKFIDAYDMNVLKYFNLSEIYDSPLKKKVFHNSNYYKILYDSLKKIKFNFLNTNYYQFGLNDLIYNENIFNRKNESDYNNSYILNYNLNKQGFEILINEVSFSSPPNVINDIYFKKLISPYGNQIIFKEKESQILFIPMDEITALEIENDRENIEILRIYNIKGVDTITYKTSYKIHGYNNSIKTKINIRKNRVIIGGNMRLIIYNKQSEEIYFDHLYK